MANIYVTGKYTFTVSAVGAGADPAVGQLYTHNGYQWFVTAVSITAGVGTIELLTFANGTTLPTSTGTLTRSGGAGYATITFTSWAWGKNINMTEIEATTGSGAYANGDTVVVSWGGKLTINTSTPGSKMPAMLQATASSVSGEIVISNTSTATPIVITGYAQTANLYAAYPQNKVTVSGDWIQIYTGTGATGQTIDFNTAVGGVAIDWPPCVWVETGDSRHKQLTIGGVTGWFMPFFNCGTGDGLSTNVSGGTPSWTTPGYDVSKININETFYGNTDHGPVFQYNPTTKIATFGLGGECSKILGGTGMSAGTHSGTTVTVTVGTGHGVIASDVITISGTTGAGAACYNGTYTVTSVTTTTLVFSCSAASAAGDPSNTAAAGPFTIVAPAGGAVIPNGARVIYPNIHFTSGVFDPLYTNRNEVISNAGSVVSLSICAFSRSWGIGCSAGVNTSGNLTISNVGVVGRAVISGCVGDVNIDNLAVAQDTSSVPTNSSILYLLGITGNLTTDYLWSLWKTTSTYAPMVQASTCPKIVRIGTVWSWAKNTTTGSFPFDMEQCNNNNEAPVLVGPIYCIGGYFQSYYGNNFHVTELHHSDQTTAVISSVVSSYACNIGNMQNFTIAKVRKLTRGAAARGLVFSMATANVQYAIKDVDYDGQLNMGYSGSLNGVRGYATNITTDNLRGYLGYNNISVRDCRYSNQMTNLLQAMGQLPGGTYTEWSLNTTAGSTSVTPVDGEPFNPFWTATNKSTGFIRIGPFSNNNNMTHFEIKSGTLGTDFYFAGTNYFVYNGNGIEVWWTNKWPIRGVIDFTHSGTPPTWSMSAANGTTNAAIEFALRDAGDDTQTWTGWYDATVVANWQTALNTLTSYTSANGFIPRIRIRTTASYTPSGSAGRYFNYAHITCTPDSTWTPPEIGFVPITVSGQVSGSTIKMYDNTVPATPVRVITQTLTAAATVLDLPYNFDATAKAFKLRLRKAGYGEVISSDSSYQKGKAAPFSQTLYVSVDEVATAALTGITVSGSGNTVTVSSNHSLDDLYAYCQWWGMQISNMDYEIPLVTTNGTTYSSTYEWIINAGVTLTGSGSVDLGSNALTMESGASSSFDWAYLTSKTWTRLSLSGIVAGSRVRVYNSTGAAEWYNGTVSGTTLEIQKEFTTTQTLDIRVAYVSGVTAKLPWQQTALYGSTGASVLVGQTDDAVYNANGIDGSGVTEFTADYPDVQIDVSDGDGTTTVQRIYAWFSYNLFNDADGVRYYFGAITAVDVANYEIDQSVADIKVQNVSALPCILTGARLYREDGTTIFAAGTGPIQHDPYKAYIAQGLLPNSSLDANIVKVNGYTVAGDGRTGTEWGPA